MEGLEVSYYLGGAKLAEKAMETIAQYIKIDFLTQLKEAIQRGVFGYSVDDVAKWAFGIGNLLGRALNWPWKVGINRKTLTAGSIYLL
jgi:hypothetical protein